MVKEICADTSDEVEVMFEESFSNFVLPADVSKGVNARMTLRGVIDTGYNLADRLGTEELQQFEEKMIEFNTWATEKIAESSGQNNTSAKRKYVPITNKAYVGKTERVFNTRNMG